MPLPKERLLYLLDAWSANRISADEEEELFAWMNEGDSHELIFRHIQEIIRQTEHQPETPELDWDLLYASVVEKSGVARRTSRIVPLKLLRWSAAAMLAIVFASGIYLYTSSGSLKKTTTEQAALKPASQDIAAPVTSKAVLTLSDGSKIDLDSIGNGTLALQGSVKVVKQGDGQLIYQGSGDELLYNTLNVPRGSKVVTIRLADGTQVWLNSESSLRYPASFTGKERKVEITGEAYFEVAHNPAFPFIVGKDGMEIRVLGTQFNVNTYADDKISSKITLLEGSVKVSLADHQSMLKPGQQAQVNENIRLVNGVDLDAVMAWKNGLFQFGDKADLHLIMLQIARWYDVAVSYEGGAITQRFGGEIPMSSNLSEVLEILRTSGVKFTIDGKKVIVKP